MGERIYVCHTYYHAYVSFLKELEIREKQGDAFKPAATLLLSTMSNDFEAFPNRVRNTGLFEQVMLFDEKAPNYFSELEAYRVSHGGFFFHMIQRIRTTSALAKLEAPFIPVDFHDYKDIYVYCDSDPIGVYLNKNRIYYHAMEDGLDSLKNCDDARYDNRGHFGIKAFMSRYLNLIFVQNGWGKYCLDMEVNEIAPIPGKCPRFKEVPRKALIDRLTPDDKEILLSAFVRDLDGLRRQLAGMPRKQAAIMILTDPLCTLDIREKIFRDIIARYQDEGMIFLKPHPRDELDYRSLFSDVAQFDATVPMEIFGFLPDVHFTKVVGVLTELKGITFADETVRLGPDFMDAYEDPLIHRQNELI